MMEIQHQITQYWSDRANTYGSQQLSVLQDDKFFHWRNILSQTFGKCDNRMVLDMGTGSGFLAIILESLGFKVIGIDCSEEMIKVAKNTAQKFNCNNLSFKNMNVQNLDFPNEYFDIIVSRNVTWTLANPELTYSECFRVLKPKGKFLNIDGNYCDLFQDTKTHNIPSHIIKKRDEIAQQLFITNLNRPIWDCDTLLNCGFSEIVIKKNFSKWACEFLENSVVLEPKGTFYILATK